MGIGFDRFAEHIRECHLFDSSIDECDVGDIGVEQGADLFADQLDQSVEVEFAGQLLGHCVDRVEFGRPLLGGRNRRAFSKAIAA